MISVKISKVLNKQMELEAYASNLYLAMSSWCDVKGLSGCVTFLRRQSDEERFHMMKIFDYISEVGGHAIVPAVKQPPTDFPDVREIFNMVYEHEKKVTKAINKIVDLAISENDHSTHNFLQWYIAEQREEEDLMRTILDRIQLIGEGPMTLYYIDKEVDAINSQQAAIGK